MSFFSLLICVYLDDAGRRLGGMRRRGHANSLYVHYWVYGNAEPLRDISKRASVDAWGS